MWLVLLFLALLTMFIPDFYSGDAQWYAALLGRDAALVLVAVSGFLSVPYEPVLRKMAWFTAAGILAAFAGIGAAGLFGDLPFVVAVSASAIALALGVLVMAGKITQEIAPQPETGDPSILYYVIWPVTGWWSFLISLVTRPCGGVSVFIAGRCYGFSVAKGRVVKLEGRAAELYVRGAKLVPIREAGLEDVAWLESQVGLRWFPWRNCYTVFCRKFGPVPGKVEK